jgi:polysaccharide export outer membrane protein
MKHTFTVAGLAAGALALAALAEAQPRVVTPPVTTAASRPAAADVKPQQPPPVVKGDYRLAPGDKLRIEVYRDTQVSQSVQVRPDGKITLPLIGDIEAGGRTSLELRDHITTALKEYMTNPVVTVIVVEAVAASAFVMGEVNSPGAIPVHGQLTVLQALAISGGLTDWAKTKDIRILRPAPGGAMRAIPFNYKEALKGAAAPIYLQAGDTVVVP